jgi:hypothetical protein
MVFCCAELLFKMLLIFTNEKHEEAHTYTVSTVEIVELLQQNTSSDTYSRVGAAEY